MNHSITHQITESKKKHTRRSIWRRIVTGMACVVVFCTVYALILPAITMEQDVFCGHEEHIHTADCFRQDSKNILICSVERLGLHVHGEDCYDADNELICREADYVAHTHDSSCYNPEGTLVCALPEIEGHRHSESCYSEADTEEKLHSHTDTCYERVKGELTCTESEQEAHQHEGNCYVPGENLLCTQPEDHTHADSCLEYPLICTKSTDPHSHDSGCYELTDELNCLDTAEHAHQNSCYKSILICELEEGSAHVHSTVCYAEDPKIVCVIEEQHRHTDSCYESILVCELPDQEGHSHGDSCYQWDETAICGLEEGQPEPVSAEDSTLVCQLPEADVHVHGASCFEENALGCTEDHDHSEDCDGFTLICEEQVHEHELSCYSDPEADVESESVWEKTLKRVNLTGDSRKDLLAVAQTQLGYTESSKNYDVWEDQTMHGYTRYGDWYGDPYGDWCAMFVSFCLNYANLDDIPYHSNVTAWIEDLSQNEIDLYRRAGEYAPVPGDLIFFDLNQNEDADHIGIVEEIIPETEHEQAKIKVLEGNSSNQVQYVYYREDHPAILGFAELPEKLTAEEVNQVAAVEELIDALPAEADSDDLSPELISEIEYADQQYRLLTKDQKEYVDNSGRLTALKNLLPESEPSPVEYNCGVTEEHTHGEDCYDTDGNLICEVMAHVHTDDCVKTATEEVPDELSQLTSERQAWISLIIEGIERLPSGDEIEAKLNAYEQAEDMAGYESYFLAVSRQITDVYVLYEDLSEAEQQLVSNRDALLDLNWVWTAQPYRITNSIDVYQINAYAGADPGASASVLIWGTNADFYTSSMDFKYWSAIIVNPDDTGALVVDQVITDVVDKSAYKPDSDGFILLVWSGVVPFDSVDIQPGYLASVPSTYTTASSSYTGTPYGAVTFAEGGFKSDKDNTDKLTVIQGADTRDLIEVNLYDYGNNINDPYNISKKYPGFQQDNGTTDAFTSFNTSSFNFGNNITADLAAGIASLTNAGGEINKTSDIYGFGTANEPIFGVMHPTLIEKYGGKCPALADGTDLNYLFTPNGGYATKRNTKSINGLFQHNPVTGAYTFNSRENHAQFNPGSDTFTLYDQLISSNFMMYPFGNFLPFNDIVKQSAQSTAIDRAYLLEIANSAAYKYNHGAGDEYKTLSQRLNEFISLMDSTYGTDWGADEAVNEYFKAAGIPATFQENDPQLRRVYTIDYDEPTDFYFGMEMKMNFMQPKDGLTGNDGKQPMVFYFTGDDDVWVYVDDVLFLDLSGIHRHVGGEIDFVNGKVYYYGLDKATGDISGTPYKTVTFAEILTDAGRGTDTLNSKGTFTNYSNHSFNFYYMERGAGSGICRMNFNFPLLRQNSISVTKELAADVEIQGNPDFPFQILKADSDGNRTDELFIGANTEYTIYDANTNTKLGTGTTDANGVFTLKAGQRAEFAGIDESAGKYYVRELLESSILSQYGSVTVSGESTTISNNVTIGSETFTGMDSPVKDMSDGATAFRFTNDVDEAELADLSVSKVLTEYSGARDVKRFDIEVTLDGTPLRVGTEYMVGDEIRTVETAGIITLAAGEKATVSNVLAGTKFAVKESEASAKGYKVGYQAENAEGVSIVDNAITGIVQVGTDVDVIVTNTENGAHLQIPVVKRFLNFAEGTYEYTFSLTEVDAEGNILNGGISLTKTAQITSDGEQFHFDPIAYLRHSYDTLPATHYYLIAEAGENSTSLANTQQFLVEVTVVEDANSTSDPKGILAEITKVSEKISDSWTEVEEVSFTNILTADLTLEKQVRGADSGQRFGFIIRLVSDDTDADPLPTEYLSTAYAVDGTVTWENQPLRFDDKLECHVELGAGEKLVIHGMPIGTRWTIIEGISVYDENCEFQSVLAAKPNGYIVTYQVNADDVTEGNESAGDIAANGTVVVYTNSSTYVLPETGGIGTTSYAMGGLLLIMAAAILLYIQGKRRKEVHSS